MDSRHFESRSTPSLPEACQAPHFEKSGYAPGMVKGSHQVGVGVNITCRTSTVSLISLGVKFNAYRRCMITALLFLTPSGIKL